MPEPLSLMPGPSSTESVWAVRTRTLLGSPPLVWAMTLYLQDRSQYTKQTTTFSRSKDSRCAILPNGDDIDIGR